MIHSFGLLAMEQLVNFITTPIISLVEFYGNLVITEQPINVNLVITEQPTRLDQDAFPATQEEVPHEQIQICDHQDGGIEDGHQEDSCDSTQEDSCDQAQEEGDSTQDYDLVRPVEEGSMEEDCYPTDETESLNSEEDDEQYIIEEPLSSNLLAHLEMLKKIHTVDKDSLFYEVLLKDPCPKKYCSSFIGLILKDIYELAKDNLTHLNRLSRTQTLQICQEVHSECINDFLSFNDGDPPIHWTLDEKVDSSILSALEERVDSSKLTALDHMTIMRKKRSGLKYLLEAMKIHCPENQFSYSKEDLLCWDEELEELCYYPIGTGKFWSGFLWSRPREEHWWWYNLYECPQLANQVKELQCLDREELS